MRDNEVVCTVWKDTKCVTVGTNQHPGHSDTTVVHNWKKKGRQKNVPILIAIHCYNKFMGGVDRSDQKISIMK